MSPPCPGALRAPASVWISDHATFAWPRAGQGPIDSSIMRLITERVFADPAYAAIAPGTPWTRLLSALLGGALAGRVGQSVLDV